MSDGPPRAGQPPQRVAQKLSYAGWHLQWMDRHPAPGQSESLLESAILHAAGAYRAFLAEIARDEHLPADARRIDVSSAQRLSGAYGDFLPPALAECVNLEAQPGWLSDLLRWNASLESGLLAGRPDSRRLIAAAPADAPPAGTAATRASVARVVEQLEQLIERLRGDMLEY